MKTARLLCRASQKMMKPQTVARWISMILTPEKQAGNILRRALRGLLKEKTSATKILSVKNRYFIFRIITRDPAHHASAGGGGAGNNRLSFPTRRNGEIYLTFRNQGDCFRFFMVEILRSSVPHVSHTYGLL